MRNALIRFSSIFVVILFMLPAERIHAGTYKHVWSVRFQGEGTAVQVQPGPNSFANSGKIFPVLTFRVVSSNIRAGIQKGEPDQTPAVDFGTFDADLHVNSNGTIVENLNFVPHARTINTGLNAGKSACRSGTCYYSGDEGYWLEVFSWSPLQVAYFKEDQPGFGEVSLKLWDHEEDAKLAAAAVSYSGALVALQLKNRDASSYRVVVYDNSEGVVANPLVAETDLRGLEWASGSEIDYLIIGNQNHPLPAALHLTPSKGIDMYEFVGYELIETKDRSQRR